MNWNDEADVLAHIEDDIAIGAFEMRANLITNYNDAVKVAKDRARKDRRERVVVSFQSSTQTRYRIYPSGKPSGKALSDCKVGESFKLECYIKVGDFDVWEWKNN